MGFEPMTCCLRNSCSTPELHWLCLVRGRQVSQKFFAPQVRFFADTVVGNSACEAEGRGPSVRDPRMNVRPFFLLLTTLLCTARLQAQFTIEQLAADPKLWPAEIKLTQVVPLQLYQNGKKTGTMQGTVGLAVRLKRVEAARLTIEIANAVAFVPPGATDLLARMAALPPAPVVAPPVGNFRTGWKMPRGKWTVVSDTEIAQMDVKDTVSSAYTTIPQSGKMEYRLKQRYFGGKSACTTIYIMCDAGERLERGNGYLIADALNEKGKAEVSIYKVVNDGPRSMKTFPAEAANGVWIDLRIICDTGTGVIEVTRNGRVVGSWTDPDPIKTGKDFSIGTCLTKAAFKDIQVRSLP